ncbi:MAG: carboxylesterase/lipase family protein [Chitinophagales bacterium]|nr:carboxylesterase/lipase family protein [Chitinophagales bacterium]MDW8418901.1 carboxylesterase/lipase family protein [Chitinophagales bacterium]
MKYFLYMICLGAGLWFPIPHAGAFGHRDSLLAYTRYGVLLGEREDGVLSWKGVPYAQPPVGALRYRAPQPPEPWKGIRAATRYSAICPQPHSRFSVGKHSSEDCLYLNIWSPAADCAKRPVMVWIHGGGFIVGSGASDLYHGANLSRNGDVVVVTLNYRLGVFGLLYFDSTDSAASEFENNLAIRDQLAALQWVKENIEAFGGDPDNITIFGESAGGTSVETLLACPDAKGLFHKAIVQSGPPTMQWSKDTALAITDKFLSILGLSRTNARMLLTYSTDSLLSAQKRLLEYMVKETTNRVFAPTVDGELIPADVYQQISKGEVCGIPLMIGTNLNEATMFVRKNYRIMPDNSEELDKVFMHRIHPEKKQRLVKAYRHYPRKRGVLDLLTDAVFRIPAIRLAENHSRCAPVYMYRFEWNSLPLRLTGLRSFHGLEIPFVFGNSYRGRTGKVMRWIATKQTVRILTTRMQESWINFARYGNPNSPGGNDWKTYTPEHRVTMLFDKHAKVVIDPDAEQRQAWEGIKYY